MDKQSSSLHNEQSQVRYHDEERAILRHNTHSIDETTGPRGEVRESNIEMGLRVVMFDDSGVDIKF